MFYFRLLTIILLTSLLSSLGGCEQEENYNDEQLIDQSTGGIAIPSAIQVAELPAAGTLTAKIFVDGSTTPIAVDNNVNEATPSVNFTFTIPAGDHTLTILFEYTDLVFGGPWELATATKSLIVTAGATSDLEYFDTDYTYPDFDNDGFTNLAELDSLMRTDPSDNAIIITQVSSFSLLNSTTGGIAVDNNIIYTTKVGVAEMDSYTTSGSFIETIPLVGVQTYLGGYTGAVTREAGRLYLTAMYDSINRYFAIYLFDTSGNFISNTIFPGLRNSTGIGYDGTATYVNQNDSPLDLYRLDPVNGTVLNDFTTNPNHGQRLGVDYWATKNVLIESYDSGISILNPTTGEEIKHFTDTDLGYSAQTFGVAINNDTLYLLTSTTIYIYTLSTL